MNTTIVTTCKSRRRYLEQAAASWLSATPCPILVVDDGCPELAGAPLSGVLTDARIRIHASGAGIYNHFSKPIALNLGAELAETDRLLFLDADTLVFSRFWVWYSRRVTADALFIVPPSVEARDLTGVLGVTRADYLAVDGADPGFVGWGAEDLDLRLRLHLARALRTIEIPTELVGAIPHGDDLRTQHYAEKDKRVSYEHNMARLITNAERASGRSIHALLQDPVVHRLFLSARGSGGDPEVRDG